jgi:hypothetical protein
VKMCSRRCLFNFLHEQILYKWMVQNGEIAEMRANLTGSGVRVASSGGSLASSAMLPQMDAVITKVDALACADNDEAMPTIESKTVDSVTDISEDEEGVHGSSAMSVGSIVEI